MEATQEFTCASTHTGSTRFLVGGPALRRVRGDVIVRLSAPCIVGPNEQSEPPFQFGGRR